ncbi:NAD(P)H-binding protein [Agrobacterium sp. BA1120]|uniref:NAD(P)H-binding protein n=1 Tax=Agrobacterium sp. BA1120 TaxID=3228927 RepID=UPI003369FCFE
MTSNRETIKPLALVLGARGGIGGHVMDMLLRRGWRVRALVRGNMPTSANPSQEWVRGDVMNAADVAKAADGASLIVHAVNPAGYKNWETLVLPMLDSTIAAAKAVGARILLPGTVYNFGPDAFTAPTEHSPQHAVTRKGGIRVEMERRLRAAATLETPVLIVRAGDFFGPGANNNWFSQGLVTPGKKITKVSNPGSPGVGHQWAYLPDVAETMGQLLDRADELEPFATYHMDGFWDADGSGMSSAIERVVGHKISVTQTPWWLLKLASPFVPMFREVMEMRYLWKTPIRMSNKKLTSFLGAEPQTPIDEAVRATLISLKCLEPEATRETPRAVSHA